MDHDQAQCARYHIEVLSEQMRSAGADERSLYSLRVEYSAQAMLHNHLLRDVIRYSAGRGTEVRLSWGGRVLTLDAGSLITSVAAAEALLLSGEHDIERERLHREVMRLHDEVARLKKDPSND